MFKLRKKMQINAPILQHSLVCAALTFTACKAEPDNGECINNKNQIVSCPESVYFINNSKACVDNSDINNVEVYAWGYRRFHVPNGGGVNNARIKLYTANCNQTPCTDSSNEYFLEISGPFMKSIYETSEGTDGHQFRERFEYSASLNTYLLITECPIICSASSRYIDRYEIAMQSKEPVIIRYVESSWFGQMLNILDLISRETNTFNGSIQLNPFKVSIQFTNRHETER